MHDDLIKRLREAFEAAEYKPGDCPVVPVKIAAFMDALRAALPALEARTAPGVELADDDPFVVSIAMAIASQGVGCSWDDLDEVNAFDLDRSDLICYAKAAAGIIARPTQSVALRTTAEERARWLKSWGDADSARLLRDHDALTAALAAKEAEIAERQAEYDAILGLYTVAKSDLAAEKEKREEAEARIAKIEEDLARGDYVHRFATIAEWKARAERAEAALRAAGLELWKPVLRGFVADPSKAKDIIDAALGIIDAETAHATLKTEEPG